MSDINSVAAAYRKVMQDTKAPGMEPRVAGAGDDAFQKVLDSTGAAKGSGTDQSITTSQGATAGVGSGLMNVGRTILNNAVEAGRHSERVTQRAVEGKAGSAEVVAALTEADLSLTTLIAAQRKFEDALQKIMTMQI